MEWIITGAVSSIAVLLALSRSPFLVPFTVFVFVFNRGVRRIIDYYINHDFNPLSPISLTPVLVAGAMLLPILTNLGILKGRQRTLFVTLAGAIAYAFIVGFLQVKMAAVYALAETVAPLGLFAYVLILNPDVAQRDRWIRSFSWGAILVSIYGWYQYMTIPPWDGFWPVETKMVGYMGVPIPTQMTVFSTMAERGPLATYLGFSVVPMIVSKRWRTWLGWPAVILVFSVIPLTLSRGGLLFAVIGSATFLLINQGKGFWQIVVAAAVLGTAAWFGMSKIPNAERVTKRFESLQNMEEDGSYKGRVMIMSTGVNSLLNRPFGLGLGVTGLGNRVNAGTTNGQVIGISDQGYFDLILTYGIPGTIMMFSALWLAWKLLDDRFRNPDLRNDHVMLGRSMLVSLLAASFVGDVVTEFSIFWLALGCGIAIPAGRAAQGLASRLRTNHPGFPRYGPGGGTGNPEAAAADRSPSESGSEGGSPAPKEQARGFWMRSGPDR